MYSAWQTCRLTEHTESSPRYTFDVALDVDQADADIRIFVSSKLGGEVEHSAQGPRPNKPIGPPLSVPPASWRDVMSHFGRWSHTRMLLGTTLSWFFLVSQRDDQQAHRRFQKCTESPLTFTRTSHSMASA